MKNFLESDRVAAPPGGGYRTGLHVRDRLHPGEPVDEARTSLEWDHANGVIARDAEANKLLRRPYRGPVGRTPTEDGLSRSQSRFSAHLKPRVSRSWKTGSFHVASPWPMVVPNTRVVPLYVDPDERVFLLVLGADRGRKRLRIRPHLLDYVELVDRRRPSRS